jgi:hypothetical protein
LDDLAGVNQVLLGGEEVVYQVANGHATLLLAGLSPSVEIGGLLLIERQRILPVVPFAEVVKLAPDLLCPATCGMRKEREIRLGLSGLIAGIGFFGRLNH